MAKVKIVPHFTLTDNSADVLQRLHDLVTTLTLDDPTIRKFYVGIASGPDHEFALNRRYDKKKEDWGINEMIAIHRSRHQPLCRFAEGCIEQYFRRHHGEMIINETGGGGGRNSNQDWHFIYLAVRRVGKQKPAR